MRVVIGGSGETWDETYSKARWRGWVDGARPVIANAKTQEAQLQLITPLPQSCSPTQTTQPLKAPRPVGTGKPSTTSRSWSLITRPSALRNLHNDMSQIMVVWSAS